MVTVALLRQQGQDTQEEIMVRDLRRELELKEISSKEKSERYNTNQGEYYRNYAINS